MIDEKTLKDTGAAGVMKKGSSFQVVYGLNVSKVRTTADDAIVEIPCYITNEGPESTRVGNIPTFYKVMIEQQEACEKLIVEAAIEGSYEKALMAFTLNKSIPSAFAAKQILDEMIEANKDYWPELK